MYMYLRLLWAPDMQFTYMYMYIGCAVLLCLVCLFDLNLLACFFLSSFSSLINIMYMYVYIYMYAYPVHVIVQDSYMYVCNESSI